MRYSKNKVQVVTITVCYTRSRLAAQVRGLRLVAAPRAAFWAR